MSPVWCRIREIFRTAKMSISKTFQLRSPHNHWTTQRCQAEVKSSVQIYRRHFRNEYPTWCELPGCCWSISTKTKTITYFDISTSENMFIQNETKRKNYFFNHNSLKLLLTWQQQCQHESFSHQIKLFQQQMQSFPTFLSLPPNHWAPRLKMCKMLPRYHQNPCFFKISSQTSPPIRTSSRLLSPANTSSGFPLESARPFFSRAQNNCRLVECFPKRARFLSKEILVVSSSWWSRLYVQNCWLTQDLACDTQTALWENTCAGWNKSDLEKWRCPTRLVRNYTCSSTKRYRNCAPQYIPLEIHAKQSWLLWWTTRLRER